MTEDELAGWQHGLNGHEFEQALGDGKGQGSLMCCSPQGCKESDMTERLNKIWLLNKFVCLQLYKAKKKIYSVSLKESEYKTPHIQMFSSNQMQCSLNSGQDFFLEKHLLNIHYMSITVLG